MNVLGFHTLKEEHKLKLFKKKEAYLEVRNRRLQSSMICTHKNILERARRNRLTVHERAWEENCVRHFSQKGKRQEKKRNYIEIKECKTVVFSRGILYFRYHFKCLYVYIPIELSNQQLARISETLYDIQEILRRTSSFHYNLNIWHDKYKEILVYKRNQLVKINTALEVIMLVLLMVEIYEVKCLDGLTTIRFRYSIVIKVIASKNLETTLLVLLMRGIYKVCLLHGLR
jgi:hypothetical protein